VKPQRREPQSRKPQRRKPERRTNVALLVLLPAALVSGFVAFGTGTVVPARVVAAAHAVFGLSLLALVPWKQLIVRRGLSRAGSWLVKACSLGLAAAVVLSLAAGLAHAYAGPRTYVGLTAMQIHVGAAIVASLLFVVHLVTRPSWVRVTDLSRRNALRLGALLGVAGVGYAAVEGLARLAGLPRRRATGSYPIGSDDPDAMPLTSWLFDAIPTIDAGAYRLVVRAGGATRSLALAELMADGAVDELRAVLDCTGGWYAWQTWRGTRLDRLLPSVRPGEVVEVVSATGYRRRFPAAELSSLWLATHVAGEPLSAGHGAPVRLVAPGRRGFWWVKWVVAVETVGGPSWWQPPFPLS
jgi:hypothetical protein